MFEQTAGKMGMGCSRMIAQKRILCQMVHGPCDGRDVSDDFLSAHYLITIIIIIIIISLSPSLSLSASLSLSHSLSHQDSNVCSLSTALNTSKQQQSEDDWEWTELERSCEASICMPLVHIDPELDS